MKITCQACAAKYTIADEKVRGKTVKIKCKKCGASIVASGKEGEGGALGSAGATGGAPSEIFWTVNVGEGDQRSVSAGDIATMLATGEVNGESYAWRDGMTDWLPLSQVPELASLFAGMAAPESSATYDDPAGREIDEDMPTKMERGAAMLDMAPMAAAAPPPSSGAFDTGPSPFAPTQPHTQAPAPAARAARAAPAGGDLFAPRALEPAAPAPLRPGNIINDEASGLIDIRNLSASLGAKEPPKPNLPQKNALDDVMGLGGAPLFSPAPMMAPPDLNAPPPPPPPSTSFVPGAPMGAAQAQPGFSAMPAPPAQKKTSVGLIIGVLGLVLAAGGIGAFVMSKTGATNGGNSTDAATTASADTKTADPAKTAETTASAAASVAMAAPTSTIPSTAPEGTDDKAAAADKAVADKADTGAKTTDKKHDDKKADDKKKKEEEDKKKAEEKKKEEEKKKKEEEEKKKAAEPAPATGGGSDAPIDRGALMSAMSKAANTVGSCKTADGPTGSGRVSVTFAPSGKVTQAVVNGAPFGGTPVGSCVASRFRSVSIPPFAGSAQTVGKTFQIN
jgi:predicted Zn finger-like uncharacterized protein